MRENYYACAKTANMGGGGAGYFSIPPEGPQNTD